MKRFSRKRRRSGRRRTRGGEKVGFMTKLKHSLGMSAYNIPKEKLEDKLNEKQLPSSPEKEASPEEEEAALEKTMEQNMQQGVIDPSEEGEGEKTTAQNDTEEDNISLFPGPPDIRKISSSNRGKEFIEGLIFHGFDEDKLQMLDNGDLFEIENIIKQSNDANLNEHYKKLITKKINELHMKKSQENRFAELTTPPRAPAFRKKGTGGRKTRRRPRKRR
jgi:hypothetical protein